MDVARHRQAHTLQVEHVDIGECARREHAAVRDAEQICGVGRQATDGLFDSEHTAFAHPVREEPGRLTGIHDLTDVRAGISQA